MQQRPKPRLFVSLLVWAMVAGTVFYPAFSVLAVAVIADLGLSTTGFGAFLFAYSASAAAASPRAGRLTDRLGSRRALAATFALAAAGFFGIAGSSGVLAMVVSAVAVALGQAMMNPSTNKLIAEFTDPGSRGVITGLKQSGVYVGYVVTGLAAPIMALRWGWQSYFWLLAGAMSVGAVLALALLPGTPAGREARDAPSYRVPRWVNVLAAYGFAMGVGSSAANFLPLFSEEALGYSSTVAGLQASALGVVAIAMRILGAHQAERSGRYRLVLGIAATTGIAFGLVTAAAIVQPALIWLSLVVFALGLSAWNAPGMLAVIVMAGERNAGAATGRVLLGYVAGLAFGPILLGWLIDTVSYSAAWVSVAGFSCVAVYLMKAWEPPKPLPH